MAIKERLLKQLNIVWDGLNAMPPFLSRDLNAMRNALVQARDLCFQGLSEKCFAEYQDTYDGLLLAIDQLAADAPDQGEIVSLCSELLQYTITQTQKETTFKKEIFFLPYKASMWDSLESVWKAADEDREHCITYVMPIPYADLTPEHTVAEWHCERELFPKDVPTVNWEDFNLEEIHPDVIFIHNPYDEYNRVTSVESRYYSSVLKNQTDKLVYIPYFVLAEPEIEGKGEAEIRKIEENIEGFVLTSAVLNAHQVVVQSEAMRKVYIDVLIRKTNQKDRAYWENRILGLGSPKIDKVLKSKKEDFEIPETWAKIVNGKKVILYNTSLNAMLQNAGKVCDKLRYVFNVFRNRDDIALWWRPHPLMKATIHSMRPEIEEEYCELERQYIKEGWGVYDDTGDLHQAIAWSDAYYGDGSSVIQLYRQTGKPVLLQSLWVEWGVYRRIISITDVQEHEGKLYFSAWNVNGIFSFDLVTHRLKRIAEFPDYPVFHSELTSGLFERVEKIGTKLYFIPYRAKQIYSYDLSTLALGKHASDILSKTDLKTVSYGRSLLDGNDIWLIPSRGITIVKFCSQSNKTVFFNEWYYCLQDEELKNIKNPSFVPGPLLNNKLWMLVRNTNILCEFDTLSGIAKTYHVGSSLYETMAYDGEKMWLVSPNGDLCWWDIQNNCIGLLKNVLQISDNSGRTILYRDGKIYAFSYRNPNYVIVDVNTKKTQFIKVSLNTTHWVSYVEVVLKDNVIYILPNIGNVIIRILDDDCNPLISPIDETEDFKKYYQKDCLQEIMQEGDMWNIQYLLDRLVNADFNYIINTDSIDTIAGYNIFRMIVQKI